MGFIESKRRLSKYLELVPADRRDLYAPLVDEMAFQETKLYETRAILRNAAVAVNGGKMPHRNAVFDGYNALFDRYAKGLQVLASAIQDVGGDAGDAPKIKPKRGLGEFRRRA